MKDKTWNWLNPLKQEVTYLDEDAKFTLAKAIKIIKEHKEDLINSQEDRSRPGPLQWLCINGCNLSLLSDNNRLKLADFF